MRCCCTLLLLLGVLVIPEIAQKDDDGPSNDKAQKTYKQALDYVQQHLHAAALDSFKRTSKMMGIAGHAKKP